jgi:hypothetical protein
MHDIINFDVPTYVGELIKKEFSSKNNEEKFFSDTRKTNTGEHRNEQRHPLLQSSNIGRAISDLRE